MVFIYNSNKKISSCIRHNNMISVVFHRGGYADISI